MEEKEDYNSIPFTLPKQMVKLKGRIEKEMEAKTGEFDFLKDRLKLLKSDFDEVFGPSTNTALTTKPFLNQQIYILPKGKTTYFVGEKKKNLTAYLNEGIAIPRLLLEANKETFNQSINLLFPYAQRDFLYEALQVSNMAPREIDHKNYIVINSNYVFRCCEYLKLKQSIYETKFPDSPKPFDAAVIVKSLLIRIIEHIQSNITEDPVSFDECKIA